MVYGLLKKEKEETKKDSEQKIKYKSATTKKMKFQMKKIEGRKRYRGAKVKASKATSFDRSSVKL